jgi:hypothetical protein
MWYEWLYLKINIRNSTHRRNIENKGEHNLTSYLQWTHLSDNRVDLWSIIQNTNKDACYFSNNSMNSMAIVMEE